MASSSSNKNVNNSDKRRSCQQQHPLSALIPKGSWDSHIHVVDLTNYPLSPNALYIPSSHSLSQAVAFEASLGIENFVLVQPSFYGEDNSCMLDALLRLGPERARAVVVFDSLTISPSVLHKWHTSGVRGVRVNLISRNNPLSEAELLNLLNQYADLIRPLGWVLQIFAPLDVIATLEHIVPKLQVKVCFDHFGHPTLSSDVSASFLKTKDPYDLCGFPSLTNLLRQANTWVKLSAPYGFSQTLDLSDVEPIARELLRVAGHRRVVFATDWPHTRLERYDVWPYVEKVISWCGEHDALLERLFKGNAEELWGVGDASREDSSIG